MIIALLLSEHGVGHFISLAPIHTDGLFAVEGYTSDGNVGSNQENARGLPLPGKCVRARPKRSLYLNRNV